MELLRLDLQFFSQEKTEKATPKKREDTRKKGQVAKSQDVNTAIILFFIFMFLIVFGSFMGKTFTGIYTYSFTEFIHWDVTALNVEQVFLSMTMEVGKVVLPIMGVAIVSALLANYIQIGFLFTSEPLKFDLKKIDPIKGFKRIFSIRALVEFLKSVFKIIAIGAVCFMIIWINKDDILMLSMKSLNDSISFFGQMTLWMGIATAVLLLFLSIFDYLYQRFDYEKNIRMSKQDIKDEHKTIEGDPLIKSRIKERQRQMAFQRMMSEVPKADVIITNPTHFAVALKYDEEKGDAPFVVAKGVDYIAFKIKEVAKANDVAIVENKWLARGLYYSVDLEQEIPEQYFQAVAEVLAYVYSLDRKSVSHKVR